MDMNSPKGKEILALIRKADYAHAGEEEAIDLAFKDIPEDPGRLLLDVGCGRGGSAHYIQRKGWGRVVGVDIDSGSIDYARRYYPEVEFITEDAMHLTRSLKMRFDIVYLFNSFYAFSNHLKALGQFRRLSRRHGRLIIFDYSMKSKSPNSFPFKDWNPLDLSGANAVFAGAGWRIIKIEDVSDPYRKWYRALVSRIEEASDSIIVLAGKEWFDFVRAYYRDVLDSIEKGYLGGAIIYAE